MKRRVAIFGGRAAVADFVQGGGGGGVKLTPPVKIGLMLNLKVGDNFHVYINVHLHEILILCTAAFKIHNIVLIVMFLKIS